MGIKKNVRLVAKLNSAKDTASSRNFTIRLQHKRQVHSMISHPSPSKRMGATSLGLAGEVRGMSPRHRHSASHEKSNLSRL
jgi:hypothetical protein